MFTDIFCNRYEEPVVGKLDAVSILLFNVFIIGFFACFNLVNISKFASFFSLFEGSVYSILTLL